MSDIKINCGFYDCNKRFTGNSIVSISNKVSKHINKQHGSEIHVKKSFNTVEFGGHHITGHSYEIKKYDEYITQFDVAENPLHYLSKLDRYNYCSNCLHSFSNDDKLNDDELCDDCETDKTIEQTQQQNKNITEF